MSWSNKARVPQLLSLRSTACEPQPLSPRAATTEACAPRARALQQEKPPQWESLRTATKSSPRSPQLEKGRTQQQRPNAAKKQKVKLSRGR